MTVVVTDDTINKLPVKQSSNHKGVRKMEIRQCDFCRAPYQSHGNKLCRECLIKLDEDFILIRDYLYEFEGAGIEEVSEATGVSRKTIMLLLKEERLIVTDDKGYSGGILKCETCRKPINTGRICASCRKEIQSAIQESVSVVKRPKRIKEETNEESIKGVAKLQLKGK